MVSEEWVSILYILNGMKNLFFVYTEKEVYMTRMPVHFISGLTCSNCWLYNFYVVGTKWTCIFWNP